MKVIKILINILVIILFFKSELYGKELISKNPYSFDNILTFSSDVDSQIPEKGIYMHKFLNENQGLHITDSIFLKGYSGNSTTHLFNEIGVNEKKSLINDEINHFEIILKEWHRGNIDTYHSAHEDMIPKYVKEFNNKEIKNKFIKFPLEIKKKHPGYDFLRLKFNKSFSHTIKILMEFSEKNIEINNFNFEYSQFNNNNKFIIEFSTSKIFANENFKLDQLKSISIKNFNCQNDCKNIFLESIEINGFGRNDIKRYSTLINLFNLNSKYNTDHGGLTGIQNFESYLPDRIGKALFKNSPYYLLDLLKKMDNEYVTPAQNVSTLSQVYNSNNYKFKVTNYDFYSASKHARSAYLDEKKKFKKDIYKDLFLNEEVFSEIIFKKKEDLAKKLIECEGYQNSSCDLKFLLGEVFFLNDQKKNQSFNLYTHFGYDKKSRGYNDYKNSFFDLNTKNLFKELSNNFYSFKESKNKIWVVPSVVFLNYHKFINYFKDTVSTKNHQIFITSKQDEISSKKFPNFNNGTSDLTGITIYTEDSKNVQVYNDGIKTYHFTRNPPDITGKESITFYNNNSPTVLLNKNPIYNSGKVQANGFEHSHSMNNFLKLTSKLDNDPEITINYNDKKLYNISHFELIFNKNFIDESSVYFIINKDNNEKIIITDENYPKQDLKNFHSNYLLDNKEKNVHLIIPIHNLNWNYKISSRPILPNGNIKSLKIGIINSKKNYSINNIKLIAHRMNGNNIPKEVVVGGKVKNGSKVLKNTVVNYKVNNFITSTLTNDYGNYYFYKVPKNNIIEINIEKKCKNNKKIIEILKPEVEINFNLNNCK